MCVCVHTGQRSGRQFSTLSPLSLACQQSWHFKFNSFPLVCVYVNCALTLRCGWNIVSPWLAAPVAVVWLQDRVRWVFGYWCTVTGVAQPFNTIDAETEVVVTDRHRPFTTGFSIRLMYCIGVLSLCPSLPPVYNSCMHSKRTAHFKNPKKKNWIFYDMSF